MRTLNALAAGAMAVSCRGVVKDAVNGGARTRILHGVDLDVHAGELTLLMGASGCGKTTLISSIAGILATEGGSIEVFGMDLRKLKRTNLVHFRGINFGIVFQKLNLFPSLTVAENVAVPLLVQGERAVRAAARATELLHSVDLGRHVDKYPPQLSVGEQQRVAIARALVHNPRLVICDEPTAALDAASGRAVVELLRRIALNPNRAVIVVTHDNRIVPFADRIAHMSDGRITRVETCVVKEAA
jgi:putative ABC transport system ATP-binding protein